MSVKNIIFLFIGFLLIGLFLYFCNYFFGKNDFAYMGIIILVIEIYKQYKLNKFKFKLFKDISEYFGFLLMLFAIIISLTPYSKDIYVLILSFIAFVIGHRFKSLFKIT